MENGHSCYQRVSLDIFHFGGSPRRRRKAWLKQSTNADRGDAGHFFGVMALGQIVEC